MKNNLSIWTVTSSTALLLLGASAFQGCTPSDPGKPGQDPMPADAYSAEGDALPSGAKLFSGTQADWEQLKTDGRFIPLSTKQNDQDSKTAEQQDLDAQGTINAYLLLHPEMKEHVDALVGPAVLDDEFARVVNLRVQGGNYLHDLTLKNRFKATFSMLGDAHKRMMLAGALDAFSAAKKVHSTGKVYEHMYDLASKNPRLAAIVSQFKKPDEVYKLNDTVLINREISRFNVVFQFPFPIFQLDPRPAPEKEVGYGNGSDRTASSCNTPGALGVVGSPYNFPLKYFTTSVKEQGKRGSCVAFGVTGALETAWARDTGQYVNLSEQDLYYHMKGYWWPAGDSYGDGSDSHAVFQEMLTLGAGYAMPYENQWDYNPSWSRLGDADGCDKTKTCKRQYTHSCDGYSETCTDTNHQGGLFCTPILGWNYCGYLTPAPTTSQQVRATGEAEIWDMNNKAGSLGWGIIALALESPMVIGLPVTPSFEGVDANGFVTYMGSGEKNRGGHALEVVGWIDDGNLPVGAPKAGDAGGGGYLIVKNSWGTCWGDTGYVYLPYQWVRDYAYSLVVLNGINHK